MPNIIRIGVSACVVGERVRYDGSHARDAYITDTLAKYVEFVPLCPEVACGMGVPREQIRQVDCGGATRLIGYDSGEDWTDRMNVWANRILPGLDEDAICGFVLRHASPSCALMQGKLFSTKGDPPRRGSGFFAGRLMERYPLLPVETDNQLHTPLLRENFVRRIFVLKRWRELLSKGMQIGQLVDFHTRHKMLVRAHDLRGYRQLGQLLGESSIFNNAEIFATYGTLLFRSLALKATPGKNADVLMHAMGFFKKDLDSRDKQELLDMITAYKEGRVPLLIPITILNHYARKYDRPYLTQQFFLNPDPAEQKLLNHA
ncbi:MAG: DUF523 and DUF1722 domain-containing protein [Pseudodesulfovibrio sp.]|uniref:DUF1722 domain-containing protein n=1 Tax=Pseudodesulfovibrio aespoeensis (strain ATCC 700646 / DSM 10631 / Aspo-2) TaxID=643562 RepID=E6VU23_PSEA9|nr:MULTISPECIES: DUF523 and DUF1722 domain-containing protein [Pseudodesulfovibrio]MBU4243185.1 DUF523 and DUF1722 domain-containing protein [Pseudomonadota bacterium]ADU62216.1 protein of unknown function DUF523 [Pseudodesulfovibrio aespoeensis Aspo-2]MBU4379482.1 DUF523 and DUF1722 domain-containing protein [Pseudomonadota bacterium]MBU4476094.1 DUF523 and DUF1722 domain-containing protein [Pseudomonadota bacterium]MBU4515316.1 DUF523 and DUF1722 domain-containing protein [Pseudomonadota bac